MDTLLKKTTILSIFVFLLVGCLEQTSKRIPEIYSYVDESGIKNIDNIKYVDWKASNTSSPSFGFSNASVWIKVILPKDEKRNIIDYVEVSYPQLDQVSLYYYNVKNEVVQQSAGDLLAFANRSLDSNTFVFKVSDLQKSTMWLKVQSKGPLLIPLAFYTQKELMKHLQFRNILLGVYFGFLLLIAFYNFLLFTSIRDQTFLWYSLYVAVVFVAVFSLEGYSYQYFWSSSPWWNNRSFVTCALLYFVPGLEFTKRYLSLKRNYPSIYRLMSMQQIGFILLAGALLLGPYPIISRLANYYILSIAMYLLYVSSKLSFDGVRAARYFFLAWSFSLIGQLITGTRFLGIVPDNLFTKNYVYFGSALEVMLLSLGLGDRINQQKEKLLQQQIQLSDSYERFVPKQFLKYLNKFSIIDVKLGDSVEKKMTVLFSDIRSFTTLSESMTPQENFDFINALLKRIGPVIRQHNGFIDKYIGDAVMALFPESANDAVKASIEIRRLLRLFNGTRESNGQTRIDLGIGIHTGNLMLGTIGEKERMEGTVISDAVNLASRLENLSKHYGVTTIASETTIFGLEDPTFYNYRIIDYVKVKGKEKSVSIIEIFDGDEEEQLKLKQETRGTFERALQAYQDREFKSSLSYFEEVLRINIYDTVAMMYAGRIRTYQEQGLPPDWDGIEVMEIKS